MRIFTMFMFVTFAMSIMVLGCDKKKTDQVEKSMLTEQEIIEISNKKIKSLDFTIDDSKIYYDKDNSRWKEHLVFINKYTPHFADECNKALSGREYHTVLYTPKSETAMGGVMWVFVDPISGEVIYILPEF
ncbi:hypothetical protein ACFL3Q_00535 [Planctomycetota bacterium]